MYLKYIFAWFGMVALAFANGTLREFAYNPYVGESAAHQISTLILLVLFTLYFRFLMLRWQITSGRQAWLIGGMWSLLTLAFEFGFGHFVFSAPWKELFHEYNLLAGRMWVFVPVWIFVAPYILFRLMRLNSVA